MNNDIRAALERLVRAYDNNEGLPIAEWIATARAALAEPVGEGPSDQEIADVFSQGCRDPSRPYEPPFLGGARAVLAKWGHPAAPPAPEVGEGPSDALVDDLFNRFADSCDEYGLWSMGKEGLRAALTRWARPAAPPPSLKEKALAKTTAILNDPNRALLTEVRETLELNLYALQQLSAPAPVVVPVAVSADVRYEFSVLDGDDCEQAGGSAPTLDDAVREGGHYLGQYNWEWDPHRLELRRVEIIPLPQAGEGEA